MLKKGIAVLVLLSVTFLGFYLIIPSNKIIKHPMQVTVGWIGPLSGPVLSLGVDNLKGVKLALSEYSVRKTEADLEIRLVTADDQYDAEKTLIEYNKMVQKDHPKAIFISTYSGLISVAPKALKDSVILIDPIDNDRELASLNRNVFLIAKETENLAGVLANVIIDHNKKNVSILYYVDDDFMPNLSNSLRAILQKNKIKVNLYPYHSGETNFQVLLENGKKNESDAFAFFGYAEIVTAMKQAKKLGIDGPYYASNHINQLSETGFGKWSEQVYIPDFTIRNGNQIKGVEFVNVFVSHFKTKPILRWTAIQAYDAATILFRAIDNAINEKGDFTENLRDELQGISNFEGVSGNISILPTGASRGIYFSLYVLENGQIKPVED